MGASITDRVRSIFDRGGIPTKDIWFGEYTGILTFYGEDAARRGAMVLAAASFKTQGPKESMDDCVDQSRRTTLHPKRVRVWRVWVRL